MPVFHVNQYLFNTATIACRVPWSGAVLCAGRHILNGHSVFVAAKSHEHGRHIVDGKFEVGNPISDLGLLPK